ncbi:MAG: DUF2304 domain-containing protein [Candidatus Komeilibacteria bacterium]|nr:DUF2304 domain-containing protein [Candidatus Komeilibacteria bacterium]
MSKYFIFQLIITILAALVWVKILYRLMKRQLSWAKGWWWLAAWLMVVVVFWWPGLTSWLAFNLGIGRGADLIVYIAILVLFYLLFRVYVRLDQQQREIGKIISHLAIKESFDDLKKQS